MARNITLNVQYYALINCEPVLFEQEAMKKYIGKRIAKIDLDDTK